MHGTFDRTLTDVIFRETGAGRIYCRRTSATITQLFKTVGPDAYYKELYEQESESKKSYHRMIEVNLGMRGSTIKDPAVEALAKQHNTSHVKAYCKRAPTAIPNTLSLTVANYS